MKLIPRAILSGPISMVHFITKNCNARCTHCFIDFDDPATFKGELTVEEIDRVTRSVGWQLRNVNLTGGEPFLRKDIFKIAQCYLTNTGIRSIYITTNGYYIERTRDFVERYLAGGYDKNHTLFFSVSVDDHPDAHDQNRKVEGLFKRAMETLRLLDTYRRRRIYANVNLTVIPANYQHIGKVYDYLIETEGVRSFTTTIMREEGVATIDPALRAGLYTAYRDLNQRIKGDLLAGRIQGFEGTGLGDLVNAKNVVLHDQIEKAFKSGEFISTCYAGEVFLILEANGDVRPCEVLPTVIGNVRASGYDLGRIWRSAEALKARRFIVDTDCHCTYECAWSLNTLVDAKYYPQLLSSLIQLKTRKLAV
ncbi:MAG: radical SAM/SPASM domain-containing protein [bacterium]